ncbi:MAG TPA: choice-of-anchor Q domain-containing protein [Fibrobacteria bacterium]|nr:choice-of-anchor Q domain-containing protein [Fibrobacteria bacterium]
MSTGISIPTDMTISTSDAGVAIEAAGTPLLVVQGGALYLIGPSGGLTIRPKAGSVGRALYNEGIVTGTNIVFQGGTGVGGVGSMYEGGVVGNGGVGGRLYLTGGAIQGGKAVYGGGLYNNSPGAITLENVKIQNNTALVSGGGIYNNSGSWNDHLVAERCAIQNNTAALRGGGVYNSGFAELHYCAVKGNKAGQGGGLYHERQITDPLTNETRQPEFTFAHTTISDNKAIATELTSGGTASTNTSPCSSTEGAGQAFDDSFTTKWCGSGKIPSTTPVDITYNFSGGAAKVVSGYSVTPANDAPGRDPMDWKFQGYSGGAWQTLHTVTGFRFTERHQGYNFGPENYGAFLNRNAYSAYRLLITKNAGGVNMTQLAEFQLYPDGQTGDGGGIYTIGHMMNNRNNTLSGNIAGCTTPSCACTAAFCATTSGTSTAMGRGGAIYSSGMSEAVFEFFTVAGNSASQGGGVYAEWGDDWGWRWSLIGKNKARTGFSPHPDFHGSLRSSGVFGWYEDFVQNPAGTTDIFEDGDDVANQDPLLNPLADNGGVYPELHPLTHSLQAGSPAKDRAVSVNPGYDDERGVSRPQGPYPDMGAFESQP